MNTISIFLAESGSVADLRKDFELYQGSYMNKLIDIYVPFSLVNDSSAVEIGSSFTNRAGKVVNSTAYNVPKIKDFIEVNGRKYALYETLLPSIFTRNYGNVTLITNVVSVDRGVIVKVITSQSAIMNVLQSERFDEEVVDADALTALTAVVNDKQDKDTVNNSVVIGQVAGEETNILGTTKVTEAINALAYILKVDYKTDDGVTKSLITQVVENLVAIESHEVMLGDHEDRITENTTAIGVNASNISKIDTQINGENGIASRVTTNEQDIATLKDNAITGINRVSVISQPNEPTPEQLTAEVERVEGRKPQNGDYIIWKDTDTNKNYNIFFAGGADGSWQPKDEVDPIGLATNNYAGIVRGNIADSGNPKMRVSIINGIINDIQVLIDSRNYKGVKEYLAELNDTLTKILNSTTKVGHAIDADNAKIAESATVANSLAEGYVAPHADIANTAGRATEADHADTATSDIQKRPIIGTYAEVGDVYTKDEADQMFLPANYNYVYYYTKNGIVDVVPTDKEPQFTITTNSVGSHAVFDIDRVLAHKYTFNKNTRDVSQIWISTDRTTSLKFRLTTTGVKGAETIPLGVDTTGVINFTANQPKVINVTCIYNQLAEEVELLVGNKIEKKLEVITDDSVATTIKMWCNETYPSTFNLVAKSITFDVNTITGKKEYRVFENDWQQQADGSYRVTITQKQHGVAPSSHYGIDAMYATTLGWQRVLISPMITDSGDITLTSATPLDLTLLIWVAVDIEPIKQTGTRLFINGDFIADLVLAEDVGSHAENMKFSIEPAIVAEVFDTYAPLINIRWAQYVIDLYRFDKEDNGDKVYFTNVLIYKKIRYTYTLEIDRTDSTGLFYKTEEEVVPQPTLDDAGKVLGVNSAGDYEYVGNLEPKKASSVVNTYKFNQLLNTANSLLPSANGLTVTNIYGGHHVVGTTDHQYYHKMYELTTMQGHWYYFAPNFSDTKSVYILGHIDGTAFSTNKGKVFEGGSKFDAYIQIEKEKTMDFDVKPILVDLTEMFGAGNEPTTEQDVYLYFDKNTYYPYTDIANMSVVEKKLTSYDVTDVITFTDGALFTIADGALDSKYVAQINIKGTDNEVRSFARVSTDNLGAITFSQMYSTDEGVKDNFIIVDTNSGQGIYHEKPMGGDVYAKGTYALTQTSHIIPAKQSYNFAVSENVSKKLLIESNPKIKSVQLTLKTRSNSVQYFTTVILPISGDENTKVFSLMLVNTFQVNHITVYMEYEGFGYTVNGIRIYNPTDNDLDIYEAYIDYFE